MNKTQKKIPISVNYHFTRKCNLKCGFCFHTSKTSFILSLEEAKRGLKLLKESGMKKINFAGGEPFLKFLVWQGQMLRDKGKACSGQCKVISFAGGGTDDVVQFIIDWYEMMSTGKNVF